MSYILDALRKADAERERDPARGIHAHPVAMPIAERKAVPPLVWAGAAAGVLAIAAFVLWPKQRMDTVAATAPEKADVPSAAPPAAPPAAAVMPPAPAPAPPAPVVALAPRPAAPLAMSSAPLAAAASVAKASAPAGAAGPADRVFTIAELPADIQRELPRLPITGGVYSDNAAQRMLIVNGVVAGEGSELAPGLVLEQIRPRVAVLKFRGWKYSVAY